MREYEYIVEAIDGYLTDELAGIICTENYTNKSYAHGHRRIFDQYRALHQEFVEHEAAMGDSETEKAAREEFKRQFAEKCSKMQDAFLKDIQVFCGSTSIKRYQDDYLQKYQGEKIKTVSKRVFLYPYLVAVSRKEVKEAARSNEKKI